MTRALKVVSAGPGITVQDQGRPGWLANGLSRGGAADRLALAEGAALLRQSATCAALELAGMGGMFEVTEDTRIALTGAPMVAKQGDSRLAWNASHWLRAGERLSLKPGGTGTYGYLHVGGGLLPPERLGARSAHVAAGLGGALEPGETIPIGADPESDVGWTLDPEPRFEGGTIRLVESLQTDVFPQAALDWFQSAEFKPDPRSNRMGVRLSSNGEGWASEAGLNVLSEVVVPGDVQITGDGTPIVLMSECQTTGGYPRIGAVVPPDLPRVAQAAPTARLTFRIISQDEGLEVLRRAAADLASLPKRLQPLVRDPSTVPDLLTRQLISGVTAGDVDH